MGCHLPEDPAGCWRRGRRRAQRGPGTGGRRGRRPCLPPPAGAGAPGSAHKLGSGFGTKLHRAATRRARRPVRAAGVARPMRSKQEAGRRRPCSTTTPRRDAWGHPASPHPHLLQLRGRVGAKVHLLGRQHVGSVTQVCAAGPALPRHHEQSQLGARLLARPHQGRQQVAARQALRIVQDQPAGALPPAHGSCRQGGRGRRQRGEAAKGRGGTGEEEVEGAAGASTSAAQAGTAVGQPHRRAPGSCSRKSAMLSHLAPHS